MKPLTLEMQNFGPYESQIIDFTSFEETPLFLISGKTGSGKTTLFDAMCFALFGKTSGMERQPEQMRSDFAKATEVTSVNFAFEHHGKVYRIMRQPKQLLAKKRGKGMRENNAKVELTFEDDKKKEKVLTKVPVVNNYLRDLLHLTAEQFTQIILLPQGKFRRFLMANSNDKESLLRELFGTIFYYQWSEDIRKRAKLVIQANEQQSQTIKVLQSQIQGIESNGDIAQWLKELENQLTTEKLKVQEGNRKLSKQDAIIEKIAADYREKCQLHDDLIKMKELKKQYSCLEGQEKHISILREELLKLEWVARNKELFFNLEDARNKSEKLAKIIDSKKAELQRNRTQNVGKKQEQLELQEQSETINKLRVSLMKGKEQVELFKRAALWHTKWSDLAVKLNMAQAELKNSRNKYLSIEETIAKQETKIEKKDAINIEAMIVQKKASKLTERQNQLENLVKMDAELKHKQIELHKLEKALNKACASKQHAQELYIQLDNDFALTQIQRLSQHLKAGTPCPVCGSRTHPAPVKIEKVREVTEEKVKEAEVNSKNTASVYHSYKGEYQAKKDQYDTEKSSYQEQYKKFAERIMGTIVTNDLTSLKLKLDQQAKELLQKKKDLEAKEFEAAEAAKKIRLLQNERKQLQKKIEAKENNIRKVAIELAQAETTVKRLNEQLPIGFDTLEELQGLLKKQQKRITVYDAKVDKLQKEVEQTVLAITACKIEIKNCQEQLIDEEKNKYQLVAKVQLAAKNCNFEVNELFIQEQLKELPKTAEYQTEIKKHEEKLLTIKTKIDQLAEHTKNAEEPQLEEIRKELTVARSKREEVADEVARYKQIYQSDEKICEQVASLWSDQQKKLEELASWNQLAEVMNGKGNLKLSLERYVLRSYLTKVLLIANDHLTRLSQGRYAFKLDKNNGTHATDTGLEINVFDDNTGKVRSVHTLSGGESFIAALALSLALGEVLQSINGGSSIEALFIDEGFGSLDEDALETALEALQTIEGTNRLFGIISHVGALRDKIPDQMQVLSNNGHSTVAYQHEF